MRILRNIGWLILASLFGMASLFAETYTGTWADHPGAKYSIDLGSDHMFTYPIQQLVTTRSITKEYHVSCRYSLQISTYIR
jgi:hypothetical protein